MLFYLWVLLLGWLYIWIYLGKTNKKRSVVHLDPELSSAAQELVKNRMAEFNDPSHDYAHVERVRALALHIAQDEGIADTTIIELAALFHDFFDWKCTPQLEEGELTIWNRNPTLHRESMQGITLDLKDNVTPPRNKRRRLLDIIHPVTGIPQNPDFGDDIVDEKSSPLEMMLHSLGVSHAKANQMVSCAKDLGHRLMMPLEDDADKKTSILEKICSSLNILPADTPQIIKCVSDVGRCMITPAPSKLSAEVHLRSMADMSPEPEEVAMPNPKKHGSSLREVLLSIGVKPPVADEVVLIVSCIGFKDSLNLGNKLSLESRIVSDADRLDAMGYIGIARTFAYGGRKNIPFFDPQLEPRVFTCKEEYIKHGKSTVVNHILEKLVKLKDGIYTKLGKVMAEKRHDSLTRFTKNLLQELSSQSTNESAFCKLPLVKQFLF